MINIYTFGVLGTDLYVSSNFMQESIWRFWSIAEFLTQESTETHIYVGQIVLPCFVDATASFFLPYF